MPADIASGDPNASGARDSIRFAAERRADCEQVDELIEQAFGPGRFAKTAERLREGNRLRADLSLCAWSCGTLAGAVRLWPIMIGESRAVFLGPIAVHAEHREHGLGRSLAHRACDLASAAGDTVVLLIGALSFFQPLGFDRADAGRVLFPGPVDPARSLWRGLRPGALDMVSGRASVAGRLNDI